MSAPTRGSRAAAALAGLLGLCQLWWAAGGVRTSATALVLAPLSLLAAVALARVNCLESRLAVVLVVTAPLALTTLALTIGLPGQPRHAFGAAALVGLVLPFSVLVAIEADRRTRSRRARSTDPHTEDPYAR